MLEEYGEEGATGPVLAPGLEAAPARRPPALATGSPGPRVPGGTPSCAIRCPSTRGAAAPPGAAAPRGALSLVLVPRARSARVGRSALPRHAAYGFRTRKERLPYG
ncbi:hypothetical protein GCM10023329_09120 [Streptomyces sanyensis]|uniref:Uncharacterized protein n=1 Tax=Streptomyces sanyensis TaxID=568869 RepID=A0ABP8ZUG9_9ACTN